MEEKLLYGEEGKYYENGNLIIYKKYNDLDEVYVDEDGYLHREHNKPALMQYLRDDEIFIVYLVHGEYHRIDGPALKYYESDGSLNCYDYFINGVMIDKDDFYIERNRIEMLEEL